MKAWIVFSLLLLGPLGHAEKSVEELFKDAQALEQKHQRRAADDRYKQIVALGASAAPASDLAEFPAHAQFILVERELEGFQKLKILGAKNLAPTMKKINDEAARIAAEYNKVIAYQRPTWALAASSRLGFVVEVVRRAFAAALELPCPPDVKRLGQEGCDLYSGQIREHLEPMIATLDEEAVKRYALTIERGKSLGISNEWTAQAATRAHALRPERFPTTE
jgi:hypothetical protein